MMPVHDAAVKDRKQPSPQWLLIEIGLDEPAGPDPYLEELDVDFTHDSFGTLRRPAFWDGSRWLVRFASPTSEGVWTWHVANGQSCGVLVAEGPVASAGHPSQRHGFLRASDGMRALVHADGSPHLVVADTPWALPWRATTEQVRTYASTRAAQGFNAALLMSVQPDMDARGPNARDTAYGFAVGFHDLADGRLTQPDYAYFAYLDTTVQTLVAAGITPVLQPVFFGFGWKGMRVAGPVVPTEDYARYCRYLVARYGAWPVMYLVGADGTGLEPQVEAGGRAVELADCYGQPTGIHYRPHTAPRAHQDAAWLDFQWCQTGHEGEHVPERVADMWRDEPPKPVMNGEPSYEGSGAVDKAAGWWQGHEAWSNLCAGATMGVAYGAGSLWQWLVSPDEPGHSDYFRCPGAGWQEALHFEGATYVGLVGKILAGLPITDLVPNWDVSVHPRGLLDPGVLYLRYAERGGSTRFLDAGDRVPKSYRIVDLRTGRIIQRGVRPSALDGVIEQPDLDPYVLICFDGEWPEHLA